MKLSIDGWALTSKKLPVLEQHKNSRRHLVKQASSIARAVATLNKRITNRSNSQQLGINENNFGKGAS